MDIENESLSFFYRLKELYFEHRNLDTLLLQMEQHVTWIGTGEGEVSHSRMEADDALRAELTEYGGAFRVEDVRANATAISEDAGVVYGELRAVPVSGGVEAQNLRFSLVCARCDGKLKLLHGHFSRPDTVQSAGCYYVQASERMDNDALRDALEMREQQLQNLTRYAPGGLHRCKRDDYFTLLEMNDGFLQIFGYTREEIHILFNDRFLYMLHPADRSEALQTVWRQLQQGTRVELEYRAICKDGRAIWILDQGHLVRSEREDECFYCLLIDVTARKNAQEELRLSLERHQVIMDQATDIIFEWDISRDTLIFSPNWRKKFGYDPITTSISGRISRSMNIHEEDIPAFVTIMKDAAAGKPYSETEFRIRNTSGHYLWFRIRATAQYDSEGHPIKAVGVILDIDAERKQRQLLLDQAQRDALTGLYNKTAIHSLIERRMDNTEVPGVQALMILDVDYFKAVNDTYGHFIGDSVLSNVAAALKQHVRSSDLVGRIGGDEFLVYLPATESTAALTKAQQLLDSLQAISPAPGAPTITCSIGVAVFPIDGADFSALYKCADLALYQRKDNGRGGVTLYTPELDGRMPCGLAPSAVGSPIGSDEGNVVNEQMAQYVFRTLYENVDTAAALPRLLEIVGRAYDVSRVHLFEPDEKSGSLYISFEWCSPGTAPQCHTTIPVAAELYRHHFGHDGVFHCPDPSVLPPHLQEVLSARGVCSMLQCIIREDGTFWGGVGFEECRERRVWTSEQIAAYTLTANVLSSFLIKLRLKERLKRCAPPKIQSPHSVEGL